MMWTNQTPQIPQANMYRIYFPQSPQTHHILQALYSKQMTTWTLPNSQKTLQTPPNSMSSPE